MKRVNIWCRIHVFPPPIGLDKPLAGENANCPLIVHDEAFDCRIHLDGKFALAPGATNEHVPIQFLFPELVMPLLERGTLFHLWDGKIFAYGYVEEICPDGEHI